MAGGGGEAVAVAGGACAGVGEAAGGDDEASAGPAGAGDGGEGEVGVAGGDDDVANLRITLNFDTDTMASTDQSIDHIRRMIRRRVGAISALNDGGHSGGFEPLHQSGRGEVEERRLHEVRVRADVLAEFVPILHVGKVASALAGDHYLPPGAGHLLQQRYRCIAARRNQRRSRSIRSHQPCGTPADYDDIRLHLTKKGKA